MATQSARNEIDLPTAMLGVRRRKRKVAKAKAESEEIKFLNIVAMVDVLTILLIFLLKSVSVSTTTAPKTPNLTLPMSTTQTPPLEAVRVTIAKDKLFVQDDPVANINKGAIPDAELGENTMLIPDLQTGLTNWLRLAIVNNSGDEKTFNLEILADKDTPYYVLLQVSYTAGQSYVDVGEHRFGYDKYRLKVRRGE
jgi:biopolymer transport protein ExbD